jgi:hypothetical protein
MNITETLKEEYLDDTYTETKKPKRYRAGSEQWKSASNRVSP